jgi:hypothetical protein
MRTTKESLCLRRCLWEQVGELQKGKSKRSVAKLLGILAGGPSEVICRNEEHHENVVGAVNSDSSASGDSVHCSLNQNVYRRM